MNQKAKQLLIANDQEHLLPHIETLSPKEKELFVEQIFSINFDILANQKEALESKIPSINHRIEPFTSYEKFGDEVSIKKGESLIQEGAVGCLVVAGGQGTRLGLEGPKGCFGVSVVKNKSIFQLIAEKTIAAGKKYNQKLLLAIMTSRENDDETQRFFVEHNFFGLEPFQVSFFSQQNLPLLDRNGKLFLETSTKIAEGPDGNGHLFKNFVVNGIWDKWMKKGVRYVNFILVDNPLADPWDPEMVGILEHKSAEISIKCILKENPDEKVGLVVKEEQKVKIIEYSELPQEEQRMRQPDGTLLYRCANIGLFGFQMEFIKRCSTVPLPYHAAFKAVKYLNSDNKTVKSSQPNAWKFETFIFDLITQTDRIAIILSNKEVCFAPLKNKSGPDSLETVKAALQNRDRVVYESISGTGVPDVTFELSQDFYYPTEAILKNWKGIPLPHAGYLESEK